MSRTELLVRSSIEEGKTKVGVSVRPRTLTAHTRLFEGGTVAAATPQRVGKITAVLAA
jgi:hypothetical protein